ncbi:flagellar basal-body MS-ring/collar protein FliF [Crenalkalicoccus roseus]|uniref:flagellar basal-body MS-ring/collar protein FliF n=1 Tax=Crenalkalicoccus roseus TaxID=1485588 RepID=UPI0010818F78|nr:flagellar basal-body MS-ring/collar protein FliF [Crenalkalicoccus roseus]
MLAARAEGSLGGVVAGLRALGPRRLAALGGVGLAVLGLLALLALRAGQVPMAPLYGELEARDAAAVVAALERARVPHRLAAGGSQVLVPAEEVPRLRLMLAREGLPAGGGVGWEIFDRGESLTTTPFQQDVNRLRALEGELARTIRGLAGVRSARVHLVLPRREAFSRERGEAQASVVLSMQGGQRLDREGVQAVLHLVATAVPGLKPQNVSIVDSRGELLARGGQALSGPAAAQTQEELRRAQEIRVARAVEELLERTLGPGRVRAEATVEMDFDRVQTTEERFDPDNQVPRSQQSVTESSRNTEPQPTSVATNIPGAEPQPVGGSQESRQEETTNFEIGRSTRSTLREHPVVRRISVAVLVDGVAEPQPDGPPRFRERTPEELARIAALVRAAAGLDERRGDRVEVVSMRFAAPEAEAPEPAGLLGLALPPALLARLAETALLALVALAAILLLGRPVVSRLSAALSAPPALAAPATAAAGDAPAVAAGEGSGAAALPPAEDMVTLAHVQGQMRASSIQGLERLVQDKPDEALMVLRRWLSPEEDA